MGCACIRARQRACMSWRRRHGRRRRRLPLTDCPAAAAGGRRRQRASPPPIKPPSRHPPLALLAHLLELGHQLLLEVFHRAPLVAALAAGRHCACVRGGGGACADGDARTATCVCVGEVRARFATCSLKWRACETEYLEWPARRRGFSAALLVAHSQTRASRTARARLFCCVLLATARGVECYAADTRVLITAAFAAVRCAGGSMHASDGATMPG